MRAASSWLPVVFVLAAGCYASDVDYSWPAYAGASYDNTYDGTYNPGYATGSPDLVDISPDVQVVADYDDPVFYSGGMYWRNYGGAWYSSNVYNGGWSLAANVPYGVSGISDPGMYAHYHRGGYGNPGYRGSYAGGYGGRGPGGYGAVYNGPNRPNAYHGPANPGFNRPSGGFQGGGGFRPGTYRGAGFRGAAFHGGGGGGGASGGFHSAGGGGSRGGGGGGGFHGGGGGGFHGGGRR